MDNLVKGLQDAANHQKTCEECKRGRADNTGLCDIAAQINANNLELAIFGQIG